MTALGATALGAMAARGSAASSALRSSMSSMGGAAMGDGRGDGRGPAGLLARPALKPNPGDGERPCGEWPPLLRDRVRECDTRNATAAVGDNGGLWKLCPLVVRTRSMDVPVA